VTLVYAPCALRDLEAIEGFRRRRSATGTRTALAALQRAIGDLEQFPWIGQLIDDVGKYRLPVAVTLRGVLST
jgi:plasmid stabilization system protein ParE